MRYLRFKIFEEYSGEILCGISTRDGGVSTGCFESLNLGIGGGDSDRNLRENYRRFCEALGVDENKIVLAIQEHTDKILSLKKESSVSGGIGDFGWQKPIKGIDGFTTNVCGVPLVVRYADCQGVFMFDPVRRVVAAAHCGWRGNVQNIIGKAVLKMTDEFGCKPADILVGISPSLGPCCTEFSEPEKELPAWMQKYVNNKHVDLWQCSLDQLTHAGVLSGNIEIMRRCTSCECGDFFSYRRDKGKTGRMGGVIELV